MRPKSHTLFHFTKNLEVLQSVLSNGFWPRYCLEDVSWLSFENVEFVAFPMVCFCDIPLSRIDEHVGFYGSYGLGMSKDWALRNGLNPVHYLARNSPLNQSVLALMNYLAAMPEEDRGGYLNNVRHTHAHIKPLSGSVLFANERVEKEFYQESEWRYIPVHDNVKDYLTRADHENNETRELANSSSRIHCMLKFTPNDVKYLFVPTDADIPPLVNFIQGNLDHFPSADLKVLLSRIISLETIVMDF